MFNKFYKSITTAAIAGIALTSVAALPSYAADFDPGATAIIAPTGDWLELIPGESHLYQFNFDNMQDENGSFISEALIKLEMGSEDSVGFGVYTPEEIAAWANGDDLEPVGVGSKLSDFTGNSDHDTKLVWANRAEGADLYYVVVENNRSDIASYYEINISGAGVSFPQIVPDVAAVPVAEEAAASVAVTEAPSEALIAQVAEMTGGLGPYDAVAPMEGEVTLSAGETRWYTFKYDYNETDGASQALAMLSMNQPEAVSFEVWTPDTVAEWVNNEEYTPIGAGTPIHFNYDRNEDLDRSTLQWAGSSEASGRYYIVVENESAQAVTFSLTVTGPDVKFLADVISRVEN